MLTVIIILSLILHCISVIAIITLYLRQNHLSESEKKIEKLQRELEGTLQAYILEMKEENEQFISVFTTIKEKDKHSETLRNSSSEPSESRKVNKIVREEIDPLINIKPSKKMAVNAYNASSSRKEKAENSFETSIEAVQDRLEMSNENNKDIVLEQDSDFKEAFKEQLNKLNTKSENIEEQVWQMKKDGYNVEEIAKKLHKGKTEIELLLKFHV